MDLAFWDDDLNPTLSYDSFHYSIKKHRLHAAQDRSKIDFLRQARIIYVCYNGHSMEDRTTQMPPRLYSESEVRAHESRVLTRNMVHAKVSLKSEPPASLRPKAYGVLRI